MNTDIEAQLRAAFEAASEPVTPRVDLADRVRRVARRRQRALAWGLVAVVIAAGVSLLAVTSEAGRHGYTRPENAYTRSHLDITVPAGVDALAAGRQTLYVATGDVPDAALSAYNSTTGRLIRRINVPALPRALRVGPDGSVWLTFYPDQNGGPSGVWLLSRDLSQRSGVSPAIARKIGLSDVLPIGAADALVAGRGLEDMHLPPPGRPGQAALRRVTAIPAAHGYGGAVEFAPLTSGVAVLQEDDRQNFRIVLAGPHGGPAFDPGVGVNINSMVAAGNGLWITTGVQPTGASTGAVVRLNNRLQPVTPRSISKNPALAFPDGVWTDGDTVMVTTQPISNSVFCFRFGNGVGPVMLIATRLPPGILAVAAGTVYAADARGVVSYRVPAACS